jgi:hypothetical protein
MTTIYVFKHVNVNDLQLHKIYTSNIQLLTYMHNTAGSNTPNQVNCPRESYSELHTHTYPHGNVPIERS